jgi:hypothetical protein
MHGDCIDPIFNRDAATSFAHMTKLDQSAAGFDAESAASTSRIPISHLPLARHKLIEHCQPGPFS